MQRSRWLPAAALAWLVVLAPAPASADVYSVFSCRDPLGPVNDAVGWIGASSGSGQVSNGCPAGGALTAVLGDPKPAGDASATWTFGAPAGTKIVRFHARRTTAGLTKSLLASDVAYILETDTATLEKCAPSTESSCIADLTEPVQKEGLNGSWVRFRAICTNAGDLCSAPLRIDTTQVNVGLQDLFAPTVAKVRLLDDGDRSGRLTVGFDAADLGGGLYRTIVKVDGKPAQPRRDGRAAVRRRADLRRRSVPVRRPRPVPARADRRQGDRRRPLADARRARHRDARRGRGGQRDRGLRPDRVPARQRRAQLDEGEAADVVRQGQAPDGQPLRQPPRHPRRHARRPARPARPRHPGRADRRLPRARGQAAAAEDRPEDPRERRADAHPADGRRHAQIEYAYRAVRPGPDHEPPDAAPERHQAQREAVPPR